MNVNDLKVLYEYGYWANRRLFRVLSRLAPEEFTQDVGGSYGSIRNTLVHALSVEWGWLDRCGGRPRGPRLNAENYPTVESFVAEWKRVEAYMRGFLSGLKDEDLTRECEFTIEGIERRSLSMGDLMQHGALHGIHHRGQIALLLRMLGCEPGNFDMLIYYAQQPRRPRTAAV